jgi:hypothetical protein
MAQSNIILNNSCTPHKTYKHIKFYLVEDFCPIKVILGDLSKKTFFGCVFVYSTLLGVP